MIQHSSSMMLDPGPELLLALLAVGAVLLAAWAGSVAWAWRDANRRGQPGFIVAVLVGLLFWPLSVIVWLLARPALQDGTAPQAPARGGRGCLWAALVVALVLGIMVAPILLGMALPAFAKAREAADRSRCLNQVREIAAAYLKYQAERGRPPEYLYDLNLRHLTCPSPGGQGIHIDVRAKKPRTFGKDGAMGQGVPYQHPNGTGISQTGPSDPYELLPGTEPTDIIVRERWPNHGGKGGAIAFGDGRVAWVDSPCKPIRPDVVRSAVEKQLREWLDTVEKKLRDARPQGLGEKSVRVGAVTFDARANRYHVEVHWTVQGRNTRGVMQLDQVAAHAGLSRYQGMFGLVLDNVPASMSNPVNLSVAVDELMERQVPAENQP